MGIFGDAHGWGGVKRPPSLKSITHILQWWILAVIPYLKKIQQIYESRDTPLSSADISIFSPEVSKSCYIKKYRYRLHNFFWVFKDFFYKPGCNLMMSAKMTTTDLLKIMVFLNKGYGVIIPVNDVTNKVLSRD